MRLITDVLREIGRGQAAQKASEELAEVTRAVMETGKAGSVTVKITVKPPKSHGDNFLNVLADVSASVPKPDLRDAMFFADAEGSLLREDPTRQRLFADTQQPTEVVDQTTGEVRSA